MLALPKLNPPGVTVVAVWHPELPQSRLPTGICAAGEVVIVILAKVVATDGPWQLRQSVTPMCVPATE
jgi:hypothetical protein